MARIGVGGLLGVVAFVAIIASISRMTSHGLTIPGGVPGGLSALLGGGGAARDLLQSTTTESLIHRIIRGGNIGLGGRIGAPLGHRTTTTTGRTPRGHITTNPSPTRLSTRSAGRSYTRFQNTTTPYTVTRLSSAGTRGISSGFPDTKTTVQLRRQSTNPPAHAGSTVMTVEASVAYDTPTTSVPKIPATLEIIPKPPPKNLIGTGAMTTQPSIVLPTFTEHKDNRQPNGQEPETSDVDVVTTESSPESSVEFHYTTLTYIHQTKVRKRDIPSSTPSSSETVTETLQTGVVSSVYIHDDGIVTDTQPGADSQTYTERIDELTTDSYTGGEISFPQSTGSSGPGKMISVSDPTNTFVNHSNVTRSIRIGDSTRTVGLLNADDKPTGGTTISRRAIALTNGTFTRPMFDDGAVTIGPRSSAIHPTIDVTAQNTASGVGTIHGFVVTRHPQSMTMPSMQKRDTTAALDHDKATQSDNPLIMTAYSEATQARLIVRTGGDTATTQLITDNDQNSITTTDAASNIKETTRVIAQATTTYSDESGKVITGTNVTTINLRELFTGKATIVASQETETVTILSTSVISGAMSPRVRTQEVDISNEENVVTIEPTVSNDKEDSRFLTYGNGQTNTSDFRGESSTNQQTTTDNEIANDTGNVGLRSATNVYTTRNPVYYSTESYTPTEQRSTNSNVKFDVNSTTKAFESLSDSTESTNNITTDSSVHARDNMATRLAFVNKVSMSTPYPVTTSKTAPANNTESKRSLPTTTHRTPYAIHLIKPKPSQPMAQVTQISTSQYIYGSNTSNSNTETNSVTTRDMMTIGEINSTTKSADFTRTLSDVCNETKYEVWLTLRRLTMRQFDVIKAAIKIVIASAVDGFCHRHPDVCCYCNGDNPFTYEYGNTTEVHYAALESGNFTDDAHTRVLLVAVTSGFDELCNMTSLQNSRVRLKRAVATNSSSEMRASLPSRVLLIIIRQPQVTADIANVIQASFPEVPCHVGVSSGQPVETSPTIQPSLNNEDAGLTPTTSLSVPRHRPVWLVCLIVSSLVIFIGAMAVGSYAIYRKRPSKVSPIRILPV